MNDTTDTDAKRVSQSQLARELDVSRQAIGDLVQRGILVLGADKRIDLEEARAIIRERVRPSGKAAAAAGPAAPPAADPPAAPAQPDSTASYYVHKAAREASEAGIAALRLRQMQGDLIEREPTLQAVFTSFRMLRNAITFVPRGVSGRLVGKASAREIELILQDALRDTFDQYARKSLPSLAMRLGGQVPPDEAAPQ